MTLVEQNRPHTGNRRRQSQRAQQPGQAEQEQQPINVGGTERAVSVAAGAILALTGISRRSLPGLLIAGVGGAMIYRGSTGHCPVYEALELDTARDQQHTTEEEISERGIHVAQAMLINKSPEELYRFWRNFENLPRIMRHVESVKVLDDRRSHWVVRAHKVPGGRVGWDAEITRDDPNALIAWRSLDGSDVQTTGQIRFAKALGDRGTEVHVDMDYVPPAGRLGKWIATIFGQNPQRLIREDLRNFKRLMEIGEILTTEGQPRGTCGGQGKPSRESQWQPLFT
jgi:uncharacterized membrane protein